MIKDELRCREEGLEERVANILSLNLSYDELVRRAARSEDWADLLEDIVELQQQALLHVEENTGQIRQHVRAMQAAEEQQSQLRDLEKMASDTLRFAEGLVKGRAAEKKIRATKGAEALHSKPGGSRDKKKQIRELWASGKYTSRDICAEQECAGLGMSFSAARKALRNTPDPA